MAGELWAIAIEGHPLDLEDLRRQYPPPSPIQVTNVNVSSALTITALLADEFRTLTDASELYAGARRIATRMSGILFARDPCRSCITVGSVYHWTDHGQWESAPILAEGRATIRAIGRVRAYADVRNPDGSLQADPPPAEPRWLKDAEDEDAVADVLQLLSGEADWSVLYMAFERMRDNINRTNGSIPRSYAFMGWTHTDHFQQSATVYRHSRAKWPPGYDMQHAMSLTDARRLVSSLLRAWLEWRCR
jgi:hypothetical protein